jgi:hypothetical protein
MKMEDDQLIHIVLIRIQCFDRAIEIQCFGRGPEIASDASLTAPILYSGCCGKLWSCQHIRSRLTLTFSWLLHRVKLQKASLSRHRNIITHYNQL